MGEAAETLFDDETIAADEAAVDEVVRAAGGERQAVRALLVQLGEMSAALEVARSRASLGFARGRQPARPAR
ncbi:hypothetical protein [Chenggangzhangella methanolivorans]|uniref:Uncharacterized protein n=1 Tax=Chenggangzhangella methanolivorans TaxID=1437009 RepID=A0A9E6R862_9HYPH|nr:hypothetical protein [Chenggangzhangella methanolivorans]QZN99818.1 hypothetical protein K6K41_24665 [Chenggangzhangella methanolivorans]